MAKRRLLRGFDAPVEFLAELTGRSPSTIRRAQSMGPSKRLAQELALLSRMMARPAKRKPKKRKTVPKPAPRKSVPPRGKKVEAPRRPLPKKRGRKAQPPARKKVLPRKKPLPRKPPSKPRRPLPRKRPTKKPKLPPKGRGPRKRKPKGKPPKRRYPSFMPQAMAAEGLILEKLGRLQEILEFMERGLDMTVKSFVNTDATVDGELRMRNLPAIWRTVKGMPELQAVLSEAIRGMGAFPAKPSMGGAFWVSFGVRFGPKNKREIEDMAKFYKRFRGLLQVGAHHTSAQTLSTILNNVLAIKFLVERLWARRDLPPVQLLVRVVWTPRGDRPGRFKGEEGVKE